MYFTQTIVAAIMAASAVSAAPKSAPKTMATTGEKWTMVDMQRSCNDDDTSCDWSFGIDTGNGDPTDCFFTVEGSPASETDQGDTDCNGYTVSTGYDGTTFGEDGAFTTLSVRDADTGEICWPSYTEDQLEDGDVVDPDQSWDVTTLA